MMLFPHRAGFQERLDRHSGAHPSASAETAPRAAITDEHIKDLQIRPPKRTSRSAISPAATSRRWLWRNG
jgi:hypothetical protein